VGAPPYKCRMLILEMLITKVDAARSSRPHHLENEIILEMLNNKVLKAVRSSEGHHLPKVITRMARS